MLIPKLIHFVWIPGFNKAPEYASTNIDKWVELNPDYEVVCWQERDIKKILSKKSLEIFNELDMPIKKADLARLEVIHKFGGIYLDCDIVPSIPVNILFKKTEIERPVMDRVTGRSSVQMKPFNATNKKLIFSREWKPITRFEGRLFSPLSRIANGVILAEKENGIIREFIDLRREFIDEKVLKYLGPHSLTSFFSAKSRYLDLNDVIVIPPHHFLWEKSIGPIAPWAISAHMGENTWGDHTKRDYWNI